MTSKIKKSYGVICCKQSTTKTGVKFLMVKKATTYHFCEFVAGHYRKHDNTHLLKLFNNMTYHEKMDILTLKFSILWYRVYNEDPEITFKNSKNMWASSYYKKKSKFETAFLQDCGERLKKLISTSNNCETLWEFPKGRKTNEKEPSCTAAMREFYEETNIPRKNYKLLYNITPYVETYNDFGIMYQNIYYFAEYIEETEWKPSIKFFEKQQLSEVSNVDWIDDNQLLSMQLEERIKERMKKCFKKLANKYKNYYKKLEKSYKFL
jgi:8-oxo-dGTP pyrophosphatase MutT (NUDIX family)